MISQREKALKKYKEVIHDVMSYAVVSEFMKSGSNKLDWDAVIQAVMDAHSGALLEENSEEEEEEGGDDAVLGGLAGLQLG